MTIVEVLAIVVFWAAVGEAIVEFLLSPVWNMIRARYPQVPPLIMVYVGASVSSVLVFISGQNLVVDYLPTGASYIMFGRIVTAVLAGRGANWIHEFFSGRLKRDQLAELEAERLIATPESDVS